MPAEGCTGERSFNVKLEGSCVKIKTTRRKRCCCTGRESMWVGVLHVCVLQEVPSIRLTSCLEIGWLLVYSGTVLSAAFLPLYWRQRGGGDEGSGQLDARRRGREGRSRGVIVGRSVGVRGVPGETRTVQVALRSSCQPAAMCAVTL